MATKRTVPASPAETIAQLTAERDQLRERRQVTAAAPRDIAEADADVARVVEGLRERADIPAGYLAQGPAGFADLIHHLSRHPDPHDPLQPAVLLAWAAPDLMASAMRRDLERDYERLPAPMSTAARQAELTRLDQKIGAIEAEIAAVWWQGVDGGMAPEAPDVSGAVLIGLGAA